MVKKIHRRFRHFDPKEAGVPAEYTTTWLPGLSPAAAATSVPPHLATVSPPSPGSMQPPNLYAQQFRVEPVAMPGAPLLSGEALPRTVCSSIMMDHVYLSIVACDWAGWKAQKVLEMEVTPLPHGCRGCCLLVG